ncbi:sensor domain-containing diguanylate cyclase [Anaerotignum sp.]|uniref:sensor domain-containing diguanylate cyclase n=1 Tax=Anaerotignum sp. TaxID=2039241 RepID=UPI00332551DB
MQKKIFNIFLAFLITLIFLLPYLALKQAETEKEIQRNKYIASQKVNDISQKLIEELNKSLEYVEVLDIIVNSNPNSLEIIKTYSEMILNKHDIIQNIAIAPNGIVQYIYPTVPNQIVIGHDLMNDPHRYPFIKKAIDEKNAIIQGPVEAIQGGVLIFNRKAIFMQENDKESFWGVSVVSIDFEKLVASCGINQENEDYYLALNVPKTDGFKDFIWGNSECLTKESIIRTISLGDQKWELFIYPRLGWTNTGNNWFGLGAADGLYVLLSLILFTFVLWHLNRYSQHAIASKIDIMTGALNKSTFRKYVIKNLKKKNKIQALIVIDIDKFKTINDTYGHLAGDHVITELANRLMKTLKNQDLLSRWGGDEFIVYINNLSSKSDIDNIIKRIHREVQPPFNVDGRLINVGVSLGYTFYPDDGVNYEELYKKADIMMYCNKPVKKEK